MLPEVDFFWIAAAMMIAFFGVQIFRLGGWRGAIFGSRVLDEMGSVESRDEKGVAHRTTIYRLESGEIGISSSARKGLEGGGTMFKIQRDQARDIAELLRRASSHV